MMRQYELVERVLAYNPHADEALLNKAYVYGMQKHGSQLRASGDPYFAHPLEVAAILTDLKLDDATIAVALLHDTIEDTDATRAEIDQLFGPEIGAIVEGLTKIDRLNLVTREQAQAENLRKLMLAISKDVRVLLVKLADRLHNMRTIQYVPPEKRKRIARETMDIYAPLAGRMGMQDMRSELEDISFKVLQPDHYAALRARLAAMSESNAEVVETINTELRQRFAAEGIEAEVKSRLKAPWSIFNKIERQTIALEQLSDIIGFRVIVKTVEDCYRTLGVVHTSWKVVPGRFKDYISVPKHNDYRSLHTTVVGPGRQRVELQIRTEEMHQVAEFGIAAHALYKDNVTANLKRLEEESQAYSWLRTTIAHLTSGSSTEEFLEYTKLELFQDQVFCFTPRGRLIALPRGATPIDFAYAVHTELGDMCVGTKVNGVIVPLITQLRSGDEVEIITDPNHMPPANWESIAATGKARAAIRRAVRTAAQKRMLTMGEHILDAIVKSDGLELEDADMQALAEKFGVAGKRELLIALGEDKIKPDALADTAAKLKGVRRKLWRRSMSLPVADQSDGWFALRATDQFRFRVPGGQTYEKRKVRGGSLLSRLGLDTEVVVSAEGVVPGDRIVGILSAKGVLTIYPIHSDALAELHDANVAWIDVRWDQHADDESLHKAAISMLAQNKTGSLAQISSAIAGGEANINNFFMRAVSPDFHRLIFVVEVRDLPQLSDILTNLKQIPGITQVRRATIGEAEAIAHIEWSLPATEVPETRPDS